MGKTFAWLTVALGAGFVLTLASLSFAAEPEWKDATFWAVWAGTPLVCCGVLAAVVRRSSLASALVLAGVLAAGALDCAAFAHFAHKPAHDERMQCCAPTLPLPDEPIGLFMVPVITWGLLGGLGTAAVVVRCYGGSGHEERPYRRVSLLRQQIARAGAKGWPTQDSQSRAENVQEGKAGVWRKGG